MNMKIKKTHCLSLFLSMVVVLNLFLLQNSVAGGSQDGDMNAYRQTGESLSTSTLTYSQGFLGDVSDDERNSSEDESNLCASIIRRLQETNIVDAAPSAQREEGCSSVVGGGQAESARSVPLAQREERSVSFVEERQPEDRGDIEQGREKRRRRCCTIGDVEELDPETKKSLESIWAQHAGGEADGSGSSVMSLGATLSDARKAISGKGRGSFHRKYKGRGGVSVVRRVGFDFTASTVQTGIADGVFHFESAQLPAAKTEEKNRDGGNTLKRTNAFWAGHPGDPEFEQKFYEFTEKGDKA